MIDRKYLEQMQAHVDEGGKLNHLNAVYLMNELIELTLKNTTDDDEAQAVTIARRFFSDKHLADQLANYIKHLMLRVRLNEKIRIEALIEETAKERPAYD